MKNEKNNRVKKMNNYIHVYTMVPWYHGMYGTTRYIYIYIYVCMCELLKHRIQKLHELFLIARRLFSSLSNLILPLQLCQLHLFHVQLFLDFPDHTIQLFLVPSHRR